MGRRIIRTGQFFPLLSSLLLLSAPGGAVKVAQQPLIDGISASVTVIGALAESGCVLDMTSQDQTVDLGTVSAGELYRSDGRGKPVAFQLKLRDCGHSGVAVRDAVHGNNLTWLPEQQVVFLSFYSAQLKDGLIQPAGNAKGIALRLEDSLHRMIRPGEKSYPQILSPGDNTLIFYIIPQQTENIVVPGNFSGNVNFIIAYE